MKAMTERKHNRPRKMVDYSKFISQDSDDDDFSDHCYTRPPKKSKLSSSDNKTQKNEKSSKMINQELSELIKNPGQNKAETTNHSHGKENGKQPVLAISGFEKKEMPIAVNFPSNKEFSESITVADTYPCISETSLKCLNERKFMESNDSFQDVAVQAKAIEFDENNIVMRSNETQEDDQDKQLTNKEMPVFTKITCPVKLPQQPVAVKSSVIPKWKAPGRVSESSIISKTDVCPKSFMGLRLGLSRNTRVKPLHVNVKVQL